MRLQTPPAKGLVETIMNQNKMKWGGGGYDGIASKVSGYSCGRGHGSWVKPGATDTWEERHTLLYPSLVSLCGGGDRWGGKERKANRHVERKNETTE